MATKGFQFYKYHGTGNDFILIDDRPGQFPAEDQQLIARLCRRHTGIGADGLILLKNDLETDFYMDYFNADGNRSSLCGNGGRCIVNFAQHLGVIKNDQTRFKAIDGVHEARVTEAGVRLRMLQPSGYRQLENGDFWIDSGSPHYIHFREEAVQLADVIGEGRAIRYRSEWGPEGTNVNFVNILAAGNLFVRTYERGVENETLSCGTGVTAVAAVYRILHPNSPETISLKTPGGLLAVHMENDGVPELEGPAKFVFKGEIEIPVR